MGKKDLIVQSLEDVRRDKFQKAVDAQHMMAVRTAEEMRKIVLVDTDHEKKTELSDYSTGSVDPQLQLVLIARDNFLETKNPNSKLGFYRAMRDVFVNVDSKTTAVLELAMKERHHREKLDAMERKAGMAEPTDAEIDALLEG